MAVVVRVGQLEVVLVIELVGGAYVVGRVVCEEEPNTVTRFCFCSCYHRSSYSSSQYQRD